MRKLCIPLFLLGTVFNFFSCKKATEPVLQEETNSILGVWDERRGVLDYYNSGTVVHSDTFLFAEGQNRYNFRENEQLIYSSNLDGDFYMDTVRYEFIQGKLIFHLEDGPDTNEVQFLHTGNFMTIGGSFDAKDSSGTLIRSDYYKIQ